MLNSIDLVSHATHLLTLYINLLTCECWTHVEYKFLGVSVARSDLARVFVAHALNRENSLTGDCSIMQLCRLEESRRERKHKVSKKKKILEKYWKNIGKNVWICPKIEIPCSFEALEHWTAPAHSSQRIGAPVRTRTQKTLTNTCFNIIIIHKY